ncbi:MAG: nucleotide exchange factor GrpE [Pseudomonadota bacterium]|jgi:molecular chaperone GrpE|nr:nucleotide exchange factor GrpE [Alphaproteobacteria bacterium]
MTDDVDETPEQEGLTAEKPELQEEQAIAVLQAEVADLKDQLLRAVAEAENIRRRAAREKQDISKFAITGFARDLLAVPDTLTRALESIGEEMRALEGVAGVIEGMELTQKQLLGILERHGVKPIQPLGEKFDPNFHQAMFEAPDTGQPDGTVIQILQTGYVIGDRLLRPALVGVAKSANAAPPAAGGSVDTTA